MVRRYIRVPDGNYTPHCNDLGFKIPGQGRPIGVVIAELQGENLVFGYSCLHPNDEYIQAKADLTAYGRFCSGKYIISMRWSDQEISEFFDRLGMAARTRARVEPIVMRFHYEFVRNPKKRFEMPKYFPQVVEHVTGLV